MRNYLVDLRLRQRYDDDGERYWYLSIKMGAATVTGYLTDKMLLALLREGEATLHQVSIDGGVIDERTVALPYYDGDIRRPYWYEEKE